MSQPGWLCAAALVALTVVAPARPLSAQADSPLLLEDKIPLGDIQGRIDHVAIDLSRHRLFVAELDRLFVAVRAHGAEGAAIWIFRPND